MKTKQRKRVIVKKYGNRRLYDTTNSVYINQHELAQMICEGRDVQVVDAVTGEDLTRPVFTQILIQHAKDPDSRFPLEILRQMIAAYGKLAERTTLQSMKSMLDLYEDAFRAMAVPAVTPMEFMPVAFPRPAATNSGATRGLGGTKGGAGEVEELKRRVAELESRALERTARERRKRKAPSRRSL